MPTEIIPQEDKALAAAVDYKRTAGAGFEGADTKAYAPPFIIQLQAQSPQCESIEGAKAGLFFNTATNELIKTVRAIPCHYQRRHLRWAPRAKGGGYRGEYDSKLVDTGKLPGVTEYEGTLYMDVPAGVSPVDKDGKAQYDTLSDTRTHFVLVAQADGTWIEAMIAFKSTQVKKSKRWMTRMSAIKWKDEQGRPYTPAMFTHIYAISAVKEENAEGTWYGMEVNMVGKTEEEDPNLLILGEQFYDKIQQGIVEIQPPADGQQ